MLKCVECDLVYDVLWHNDGMEAPTNYCPRCGSEDLEETEEPT
jgi:uncharacterized paraquat-inducible protein A